MTSPVPGVTGFGRRRDLRPATGASTAGPVNWRNVVIVDQDGGGDFTTIQAAINSITTASASEVFTVFVMGGNYVEATLTFKSFVMVKSITGGGDVNGVRVTVTNTASGAIVEADDSGIEDIMIVGTTGGSDWTLDVDTSRVRFHIQHCRITGRSRFGAGTYTSCHFTGTVDLNGASNLFLPSLTNCTLVIGSSRNLSSGAADYGHITGGMIFAAATTSTDATINLGVNIVCTGVDFVNDRDGLSTRDWAFTAQGLFSGCSFTVYDEAASGSTLIESLQGTFTGCSFNGVSIQANSASGPLSFAGCQWDMHTLGNGAPCVNVVGGVFPVILTGCILRGDSATDVILDTTTTNVLLELSGNTYRGIVDASILNLRIRGTDVRSEYYPVDTGVGSGAAFTRGMHSSVELGTATETAFVTARLHPPANVAQILDARLIVSGEFDKAEDSFTDSANLALASHTSDTGEAWTLVQGTARIGGTGVNATGTNVGIHTWGAAGDTGFLQSLINHGGSASTQLGLIFRYVDASNYWRVEIKERTTAAQLDLQLIKREAASESVIASTHVGTTSFNGVVGVSFFGDDIKVFCDTGLEEPGLALETTDTFNNTATVVGLLFAGVSSTHYFDDLAFWRGDKTLDLTVDTETGQEASPLDEISDSVTLANQAIAHRVFTYLDIKAAFTDVKQGSILGVRVTLDALGTVNTALHVHGVLIRTLPTSAASRPTQTAGIGTEAQQVTYR